MPWGRGMRKKFWKLGAVQAASLPLTHPALIWISAKESGEQEEGNLEELLCHVACCLGFYDNPVSF